jgi:hemoglobin
MFKHPLQMIAIAAAVLFTYGAVAQDAAPAPAPSAAMAATAPRDPSLRPVFDAFGGKPGLVAIMNDFMDNLVADPRTKPYFIDADRDHIKAELVDQFCVILDGPCTYTGKDMAKAHRNLGIDHAGFYALVEDLQTAMNKHKVPFRAQNKLLAKLAPMNRAVVTK